MVAVVLVSLSSCYCSLSWMLDIHSKTKYVVMKTYLCCVCYIIVGLEMCVI